MPQAFDLQGSTRLRQDLHGPATREGHNLLGHNCIGHNYIHHNSLGNNSFCHNFLGHSFLGHTYIGPATREGVRVDMRVDVCACKGV